MTVTLASNRTDAETALLQQFAEVAAELPGDGWVPAARAHAIEAFKRSGLPHRRLEAWKYTDLRGALKSAFKPSACSSVKITADLLAGVLGPELAALPCIRLVLLNGRMAGSIMPAGHEAGRGYRVDSLAGLMGESGHDWMPPLFDISASDADPVMALNAAFVTDGIVLRVEDGARLALPIHVVCIADTSRPAANAVRHLIKVGAGAAATIIESHVELGSGDSQSTAVTQLHVVDGGEAHHVKHVAIGAGSAHLARTDIELGKAAIYSGFQLTAGAGLLRNEVHVGFTGPDAAFDLSGLMLGRGRDHIDTTLVIEHTTTGCESRELFKAVLAERARGVFQGKVLVAAEAQKTDGKQMAKALMLSEDAEFDSKPELEIYADDVACGHGSTAAELDADLLFYLRARGIPLAEARALLIESFAAEALEKIDDETVRAAMRAVAVGWLGTLG